MDTTLKLSNFLGPRAMKRFELFQKIIHPESINSLLKFIEKLPVFPHQNILGVFVVDDEFQNGCLALEWKMNEKKLILECNPKGFFVYNEALKIEDELKPDQADIAKYILFDTI